MGLGRTEDDSVDNDEEVRGGKTLSSSDETFVALHPNAVMISRSALSFSDERMPDLGGSWPFSEQTEQSSLFLLWSEINTN